MNRLIVGCAAGIVLGGGWAAPGRVLAKSRCPTRGSLVVAVDEQASVYAENRAARKAGLYRACSRRTGRSFDLLYKGNPAEGTERGVNRPVLAGHYVAISFLYQDRYTDGPQYLIRAYNIRRRKRIAPDADVYSGSRVPRDKPDVRLTDLQIATDGGVAWIATPPQSGAGAAGYAFGPTEVRYESPATDVRVLDASPAIVHGSLALTTRAVYWQDDGARSFLR